jgi:ribose transport system substrate-binding protein
VVTIPTYPILTAQVDAMRAELGRNCPSCKASTLEVTVNDLVGGTVPQNISSYLQANPDVNYVYFTYASLANGVAPALRAAGLLSKVKLVGTQGSQPQMKEVANGTAAAWSALPQELSMWTMVDQMARLSVDQWSLADERKAAVPPFYLVTTADAANAVANLEDGWPGPTGFKDTFKKLWGV